MYSVVLAILVAVGFSSAHVPTYHAGSQYGVGYARNGHYGHAVPHYQHHVPHHSGYVVPRTTYGHHVPVHGVRYSQPATYEPVHHGYGYRHHEAPVVVAHPQPTYGHHGTYVGNHHPHAYSTVNTVKHIDGYGNGVHAVAHSVSHGHGSHSTVFKKQVHTH